MSSPALLSRNHRIHVNWLLTDLHHNVDSAGCYGSIHGPFPHDDEWTQRVFPLKQFEHVLGADNLPDLDDTRRPSAKKGAWSGGCT